MAIVIDMPKLSDTMTEGKILSWLKQEGAEVEPGDILAEVESDKANMELEAYDAGILRKILVADGDTCAVGAAIAVLAEDPTEDVSSVLEGLRSSTPASEPPAENERKVAAAAETPTETANAPQTLPVESSRTQPELSGRTNGGRILASPLALRMAAEYGLNLREIVGTGPDGRVVKRDIEKAEALRRAIDTETVSAVASTAPPPFQPVAHDALPSQTFEDLPVSSMRGVIARRLSESMNQAPHFYLTMDVDMKNAIRARELLNSMEGVKVSFNDFVVKAVALALTRNPNLNAAWQGKTIRRYNSVDIGIAVALPDGLVTPIVRACHLKGLGEISQEVRALAHKAKDKKLSPEEYQGSTFTISNLGMFGVKSFTAIINPPEACILAVGSIREVPVVEDGKIVPGTRMECTVSCDHRVVDGAQAAHFMRDLQSILENPVSLAL
ncbi:MAG: pyruvate dehydrogenase complex dihydrolipoamide acetyltransferase [Planctomycetes bacterium]|nr:pyruvate dehydrogenase complex dihydrolipoamide acetyltransferase [Planctomycetota bacterium]